MLCRALLALLLAHSAAGFGITGNRPRGLLQPANRLGLFSQVGKRSEDLLRDIPSSSTIETETPTVTLEDGSMLKFSSSFDWTGASRREGGRVVGVLTSRLRRSFYNSVFRQPTGLEVVAGLETGLENDAQTQVIMRCSPSTKFTLDVYAPEVGSMRLNNLRSAVKDVKARAGVEVTTDLVSVSSAHFIGSTRFLVSAVAGAMGWAGGISAIFNTYNGRRRRNAPAIQDPRLALQYTCDSFQVGCTFSDDMEDYTANFHHFFPEHAMQVAGHLEKKGPSVEAALGLAQEVDPLTKVRATLKSTGRLGAVVERRAGANMLLRCSAEVDSGLNPHSSFHRGFRPNIPVLTLGLKTVFD
jgi:hypothetical protein